MRKYTTIQGDTWDIISLRVYGNENYVSDLVKANLKYKNEVFFSANIALDIPEITVKKTIILPPWK